MSDATQPATADELAAVYLRGRDVACPQCGYNRRDGVKSECPECGEWLDLRPPQWNTLRMRRSTAVRLGWLMAATTGLAVVSWVLVLSVMLNWWGGSSFPALPWTYWAQQAIYPAAMGVAFVMSIAFLRHVHRHRDDEVQRVRWLVTGMAALLIGIGLWAVEAIVQILY